MGDSSQIVYKIIRKDFFHKLTLEQRHESNEEASCVDNGGRTFPAQRTNLAEF